jgi:hypothetical protein
VPPASDFRLKALFEALDAERQARGLSWAQVMRQMKRSDRGSGRGMSPSTVTGIGTRTSAEGDGVLQMLRWLGRSPETFIPGYEGSGRPAALLPDVPPDKILRFDTRKIYAALDAQRVERNLTWDKVAKEARVGVSSLTRLSKGGRTGFPGVMRIIGWLNRPVAEFTRASDR